MKRVHLSAAMVAFAVLLFSDSVSAKFAMFGEHVPAERLIENVSRFVEQNPRDARGHYTLGRLHSIAFTGVKEGIYVVLKERGSNAPLPLPQFGPTDSVRVERVEPGSSATPEQRKHLLTSLREYRRATELAPKEGLYWLGLGWMREQAVRSAGDLKAEGITPSSLRAQALAAYRKAYALTQTEEAKQPSLPSHSDDAKISLESGLGILRLLPEMRLTPAQRRERTAVASHVKAMKNKPQWVTPILIGRAGGKLSDLLAEGRSVRFDLAARGESDLWPWVKPDVGILVWDPTRSGKITSGSQLFGSRTWQMMWRNGYEPLAALDNDGDGWLRAAELKGIAVWYDGNSNGRSDRGEILTAELAGILEIAVRASSTSEGVPAAAEGIRMGDGSILPTFDWTPRSLPVPAPRRAR